MQLKNYLTYLLISFLVSKRITIVLSDVANKKARLLQAKLTTELEYSVSFSKVAERLMLEGLESINIKNLIKEMKLKKNK